MYASPSTRSPGVKLGFAILVGLALSVPLFMVWMLVYDRQRQSEFAQASIAEGWAGPQVLGGPTLAIPYRVRVSETALEGTRQVTRTREVWRELTLSPETSDIATEVRPERRVRSIYEAVVYEAAVTGRARFAIPRDLARFGLAAEDMDLARAELRFHLADPRGLGANPRVAVGGEELRLQPGGGGSGGGTGFFAWLDAAALGEQAMDVDYSFAFRGNRALALAPQAGETRWALRSPWPHPSFQGSFLPGERDVGADGFTATYRIGNLALGQSLVATHEPGAVPAPPPPDLSGDAHGRPVDVAGAGPRHLAQVSLVQPADLYAQVDRAAKYGFLFIGFTFLAFLLFDVIGGVRVSAVEYLLVGAGLVLFFVLLLAFAEVIGFTLAYMIAAAAIAGLVTAYSAAVLKSWRRAAYVGGLLTGLYVVLYVLLSLEAYSLLIGSLMLFAALAGVMYLTRNLNWGARDPAAQEPEPA
jgi:inner membrane protein